MQKKNTYELTKKIIEENLMHIKRSKIAREVSEKVGSKNQTNEKKFPFAGQ